MAQSSTPGFLGYKTALERLRRKYRQTKLVVNSNKVEIITFTPVKGNNVDKLRVLREDKQNYDT